MIGESSCNVSVHSLLPTLVRAIRHRATIPVVQLLHHIAQAQPEGLRLFRSHDAVTRYFHEW